MIHSNEKYDILESIYRSSSSFIFRALDTSNNKRVVIKTMNVELYDIDSLNKLKHEYKLLKKLQGDWVVQAFEFVSMENRFSMVIEDFGAVSLAQYLESSSLELNEFLSTAIKICKCLEFIHQKNVVHKDLNPSNIVYNPRTGVIKLIDFGISSEYAFESTPLINPNILEGTIAYMSPEQTGRMNRPIDYRTDFYSLGVTLYELASLQPPFVATSAAEMVHCHIAVNPKPVYEINSAIPKAVSAIIAKLMAKIPEDRYRSCQGIIADLKRCADLLHQNQAIEEFSLASQDISSLFEMPQKLYGRDLELNKLLNCFENSRNGTAIFVLVGGYSGIGKTTLVNELHKPIVKDRGIFISGKFDQYSRNEPYSAIFQAINQFCQYVLSESEPVIKNWKKLILQKLSSNAGLINNVIPRMELIIGKQPPLQKLSPTEEQARFKMTLKNLILSISESKYPLVFFIDDVHWADMASLGLLETVLSDRTTRRMMFIGTYRDNEVDASHPLLRSIEKIKKNNGNIQYIQLGNLNISGVGQMIADIVKQPEEEVFPLSKVIYSKTMGNPFYTKQILKQCYIDNLIYYDSTQKTWAWKTDEINIRNIAENVADYLIKRINTFSDSTRELISVAACIGSSFDKCILAAVAGQNSLMIEDALKLAVSAEMIYVSGNKKGESDEQQFTFCHDRFQQAAYQNLSEQIRQSIHLNIARYYENLLEEDGIPGLFLIADHYSKALDCLQSSHEVQKAIEIFFQAARAAILSSAYITARKYLELIMDIAGAEDKNNYSFLVRLYSEYHLVLFSLAEFEEMDKIYDLINRIVKDPLDLVDPCCIQVVGLSNRSKFKEAFMQGIELLARMGVYYPDENDLLAVIEDKIDKYYQYESSGLIERLKQAEMLNEKKGSALAKLLNRIIPAALFFNPFSAFWATISSANLMVERGFTVWGLAASAISMMVLINMRNDFRQGYYFAKTIIRIAEKNGFHSELYRIYHTFGLFTCHWFEPLEIDIYYAHEAFKGNLQNGEFEFSCFSYFTSQAAILEICESLAEMENEVAAACAFASKTNNIFALSSFVIFQQVLKVLRGETFIYGSFNDPSFSEELHGQEIEHNPIAICYYRIYRALSAVIFGDYTTALSFTESVIEYLPHMSGFYTVALHGFLHSLSICKEIETRDDSAGKAVLAKKLQDNQEWLFHRAQDAPCNFQHLYDLIDAEMKGIEGKYKESFNLYEKAILGAKENRRTYHYALACELAGKRYLQIGVNQIASFYIKEAYTAFLSWGATGKTEAMKEQYSQILLSNIDVKTIPFSSTGSNYTDSIDLDAVIRSSQAISGEIERKKLLKILMSIILENSGSTRACILLNNDNSWSLSSCELVNNEVEISIDDWIVWLDHIDMKTLLPVSVIAYTARTREALIIGSAQYSRFISDEYIQEKRPASLMCFPIISHKILKGIVYLENELLTEAYTQERLKVLNILASQAAISLENALLYSKLEKKVEERTLQLQKEVLDHKKTEQVLRQSEEKFSTAFHAVPIMMMVATLDEGRFIDVNEAFCAGTGYKREDIIGCTSLDRNLFQDTQKWQDLKNQLMQHGKLENLNLEIRYKSGELGQGKMWSRLFYYDEKPCHITAYIDITEQQRMEKEMARLDRLNLVGEMAASIGHEIRNPMTAVRGFLQMLRDRENYKEDLTFFNIMIEELDRANGIISEYLNMARDKNVDLQPKSLDMIVKSIYPMIQADANYQEKKVKLDLGRPPTPLIDESEIRQMILNLARNGLEAMLPGGVLTIGTNCEEEEIVLLIKDEGGGIDPMIMEKLGTPFITTKEKGTGLGLAVCYSIAARHHAKIKIETGAAGTTFSVHFPAAHVNRGDGTCGFPGKEDDPIALKLGI